MNRKLLDILACPMDKYHPLELFGNDADMDNDTVETAALYCKECGRFYVVDSGIPILLPDELRDEKSEKAVLEKIYDLPDKIKLHGKPWNLT